MRGGARISVIIPALNEEESIGRVLSAIPDWVDEVVVVDNGSTDSTPFVARRSGAKVIFEPRRGYGSACLTGIGALEETDIVVFLDGDFSDRPEEMPRLVDPIAAREADMVIGSRMLGNREPGALTPQAIFGNRLACTLIRLFWNVEHTDLGPFRAIDYNALERLRMRDPDYGWTVEMQIRAAAEGLRVIEVPVSYGKRIGRSKVSGTFRGVLGAGTKILSTIFLSALRVRLAPRRQGWPERLIVFTRYPEPGKTKTRLIPAIGANGAAELQRGMTEDAILRADALARDRALAVEIRYDGSDERRMAQWLGKDRDYAAQGDGDLGDRQARAFAESFARGTERVVLVGTDCPDRTVRIMEKAFESLRKKDLVLGPARDGGYYLIGLRRHVPPLFQDVQWGSDTVLERTLQIADEFGLAIELLETLNDIDRPEDLTISNEAVVRAAWPENSTRLPGKPSTTGEKSSPARPHPLGIPISVIVPTLNEAATIRSTLERILGLERVEVIVADGGSSDGTAELARSLGAAVVESKKGRAVQMNAGAAAASGEALVFLHADTLLPDGWTNLVREIAERRGIVGGAFEFKLDETLPWSRIIERLAHARSRILQMPYGDQAIFLKADLLRKMGGFPEIPIMEDFEFVRRLRAEGDISLAPVPATTSARRWKRLGVLKTTLINQIVILAYFAGVPPDSIARLYRMGRDRTASDARGSENSFDHRECGTF
jgi:rSAM/selenodomain-associated transferase 2/rSAM/selenodomain-associated transferase 1